MNTDYTVTERFPCLIVTASLTKGAYSWFGTASSDTVFYY